MHPNAPVGIIGLGLMGIALPDSAAVIEAIRRPASSEVSR
jgi:hypothetical protein